MYLIHSSLFPIIRKPSYEEKGISVATVKEPGQTELGKLARKYILNVPASKRHDLSDMLLFLAARTNIYEELLSSSTKDVALFDRHYGSTFVYQCCIGSVQWQLLKTLTTQLGYKVDLSFILDLDTNIAYSRYVERERLDPRAIDGKFIDEKEFCDYNDRARMCFWRYYTDERNVDDTFIINSNRDVKEMAQDITAKIVPLALRDI